MRKPYIMITILILIVGVSFYAVQTTGICLRDYYKEVGVESPKSDENERFYSWMFGSPLYDKILKNYGNAEEKERLPLRFKAYIFADADKGRQLNFFDYNTFPGWAGVATTAKVSANFDYIDNALASHALRRSLYIFWNKLEDNAWNNEIKKNIQYLYSQEGEIDSFNLAPRCWIKRKRISHTPLYTYAEIDAHATSEEAAKCIFTTIMVNYGFSNATAIYAAKNNVICTEAKPEFSVCALNPTFQPHGFLYGKILKATSSRPEPFIKGGESLCEYRNVQYRREISYCHSRAQEFIKKNAEGFSRDEVAEIKNRCELLGVKMKM